MNTAVETDAEAIIVAEATLQDPVILAQPRAFYAALRHKDPIHYDAKLGSWLVTRHEDISTIQSDAVTFSVNQGYHEQQARGMHDEFREILRNEGGGNFPDAIMSDPPYH